MNFFCSIIVKLPDEKLILNWFAKFKDRELNRKKRNNTKVFNKNKKKSLFLICLEFKERRKSIVD